LALLLDLTPKFVYLTAFDYFFQIHLSDVWWLEMMVEMGMESLC